MVKSRIRIEIERCMLFNELIRALANLQIVRFAVGSRISAAISLSKFVQELVCSAPSSRRRLKGDQTYLKSPFSSSVSRSVSQSVSRL